MDDGGAFAAGAVIATVVAMLVSLFIFGPEFYQSGQKNMFRSIAAQRCAEYNLKPMFDADRIYTYICVKP